MKKIVALLLAVLMVFALAACGHKGGENSAEYEVTPDKLKSEESGEVISLEEGQTALESFDEAAAVLGGSITWPEDYDVRVIVLDEDNTVSVEFTYNEIAFVGRYFPGEKENMSGLAEMEFDGSETLSVNGAEMELRFPTEETNYNAIGVAEGQGNGISYMLLQQSDAVGGEMLAEVTEAFVNALQF